MQYTLYRALRPSIFWGYSRKGFTNFGLSSEPIKQTNNFRAACFYTAQSVEALCAETHAQNSARHYGPITQPAIALQPNQNGNIPSITMGERESTEKNATKVRCYEKRGRYRNYGCLL